jgi:hypothetical protein
MDYWKALEADIAAAGGDEKKLQSQTLRGFARDNNDGSINKPIDLGDGVTVELMFSPNTNHPLRNPPKEVPNDMKRLFDLIDGAKHAVLFLAFDPGNNSILDAAGRALARNPDLFVRGALTSAQRASNFSAALHQGGHSDQDSGEDEGTQGAKVTVVGEPGKPKKKGAKQPKLEPDARAVPAGAVTPNDVFGAWEAELAKFGFAIIHNKIVVIDPFSDNCTVVTGSHNLGFRASHNNDENMLIIRGHRGLAAAYACHVLDLYDHYAWRFLLREHPEVFGKPLQPDDTWQEHYISGPDEKSPELRFWLSAATGGDTSSSGAMPQRSPPGQPTRKEHAGTEKSSKTKTARTKTRTKTIGKKTAEQAPPKKKTITVAKRKVPAKKKAAARQKVAKQKVAKQKLTSQGGANRKVAKKRVSAKKVASTSAVGKKTTKGGVKSVSGRTRSQRSRSQVGRN